MTRYMHMSAGLPPSAADTTIFLQRFGASSVDARFIFQELWHAPMDSDKDAHSTKLTIKAVQRGLNRAGFRVAITGTLTRETAAALQGLFPNWKMDTWLFILQNLASMRPRPPGTFRPLPPRPVAQNYNTPVDLSAYGEPDPDMVVGDDMVIGDYVRVGMGEIPASSYTASVTKAVANNEATKQAFVVMQIEINKFFDVANFPPIKVDGEIGSSTINAVKKANFWIANYENLSAPADGAIYDAIYKAQVPADIAKHADMIANYLSGAARKHNLKGPSSGPGPVVAPPPHGTPSTGGSDTVIYAVGALGMLWLLTRKKSGRGGARRTSRRSRRGR